MLWCWGTGKQDSWPRERQPVIQQALAEHLISLRLEAEIDDQECAAICGLTRLVHIHLTLRTTSHHPIAGLTALQRLACLHLKDSGQQQGRLDSVDWSSMTQLAEIVLAGFPGAWEAASTARNLEALTFLDVQPGPPHWLSSRMQALRNLHQVYMSGVEGLSEVQMLHHVPQLQQLTLRRLLNPYDSEGRSRLCEAIGRLTGLTRLHMDDTQYGPPFAGSRSAPDRKCTTALVKLWLSAHAGLCSALCCGTGVKSK